MKGLLKLTFAMAFVAFAVVGVLTLAGSLAPDGVRAARVRQAQAEARRAEVRAQVAEETAPAAAAFWQAVYIGAGGFVILAGLGGGVAVIVWGIRRAGLVAPTQGGQYPLIRVGGAGWTGVFDPNRSPSSVTVFKGPTAVDALRGRDVTPQIAQPTPLSEGATLQLAGQATAAAMTAAATRHPTSSRANMIGAVESVTRPATLSRPLPPVEVIEDADHIDRLLELTAPVEGADDE